MNITIFMHTEHIESEQILSEFVKNFIDEQLPPNFEFDSIIAENIWELYQYGFPSQNSDKKEK